MSLLNYAKSIGAVRLPSFRLEDGGECLVYTDRGQTPDHVALHNLGPAGKRRCKGEGCSLCEAGVACRENWIVTVDRQVSEGVLSPCSLWLTKTQLGSFAQASVGGDDGGSAIIKISKVPELDDDGRKKPKTGGSLADGPYWHRYQFAKAGSADNDDLDTDD
jgi:hypothetical protein